MEVHFTPELEKQLTDLSALSGRPANELVQEVMAGYVREVGDVRHCVDSRYDDLKTGRIALLDGEAFFDELRRREDELLESRVEELVWSTP